MWQVEGPVLRENGAAAPKLQPVAACRNLGSVLLDLFIKKKKKAANWKFGNKFTL